jgi:hypothetical protein
LKFGRTLASVAAIFYTVKNALQIFKTGIDFAKEVEESRLSLAALIGTMYDYQDSTGKAITGAKAFDAAVEDAIKLQKDLRIAGLLTAATYQELLRAMQVAFGPATQAGIKLEQLTGFVQRFAQIMQVMVVPMNQASEEMRSFLTGVMVPRQTRLEGFWRNLGFTNEKIKQLVASGKLYDEMMKRTSVIEIMAAKSAATWSVALSNLQDAFQNIMGVGLEGTFSALKTLFMDMFNWIVQIDMEAKTIQFNPEFLAAIKEVSGYMETAIIKAREFKAAYGEWKEAHPILSQLTGDFASIGLKVVGVAAIISGLFKAIRGLVSLIGGQFKWLFGLFPRLASVIAAAFSAFVLLPPQLKIIVAAATLLAGVIGYLSDDSRKFSKEIGAGIEGLVGTTLDWIGSWKIMGISIRSHLIWMGNDIANLYRRMEEGSKSTTEKVADYFANLAKEVNNLLSGIILPDIDVFAMLNVDTADLQGEAKKATEKLESSFVLPDVDVFGILNVQEQAKISGEDAGETWSDWFARGLKEDPVINFFMDLGKKISGLMPSFAGFGGETAEYYKLLDKQYEAAKMLQKLNLASLTTGLYGGYMGAGGLAEGEWTFPVPEEYFRVTKPEDITLTDKQISLLERGKSILTSMNEEAARLTDDSMVRLISHIEKQNVLMEQYLIKLRSDVKLREYALYLEKQFIAARERLIQKTIESNQADFERWVAKNVLPDTIGLYKELGYELEDIRNKYFMNTKSIQEWTESQVGYSSALDNTSSALNNVSSSVDNISGSVSNASNSMGAMTNAANSLATAMQKWPEAARSGYAAIMEGTNKRISELKTTEKSFRQIPPWIDDIIVRVAEANQMSAEFIRNIMRLEAPRGFNPAGLGPMTRHGQAVGLMQLLPSTFAGLGFKPGDITVPEKNIEAGAKYLKQMLDWFGDEMLAAAAYNMGGGRWGFGKEEPSGLRKVLLRGYESMPEETKQYLVNLALLKGGYATINKELAVSNERIKANVGYTREEALAIYDQIRQRAIALTLQEKELSQRKSIIDAIAESTTNVAKEVSLRMMSLSLESDLSRIKLEQWLNERHITDERANQWRQLNELAIAEKERKSLIELSYKEIERQNEGYRKIAESMGIVASAALPENELQLRKQILAITQKTRDDELSKWLAINEQTPELEKQVRYWNEQAKQAENLLQIVNELKAGYGGMEGYFAAWSYDRIKESANKGYESFKQMMDDIERDISDAISAGIIDALRGKRTDFSEMFFSMAEESLSRAVNAFVSNMFDQLASFGAQMFGQELPGLGKASGILGKLFAQKPDGTPNRPYWVALTSGKAGIPGADLFTSLFGGGGGGGVGGFEYPAGFNPMEAGYGGWPIEGVGEYQQALQQNVAGFYQGQANWFTNLLGLTAGPQGSLMTNTSSFYNQQIGFFGNLLGKLPGWLGKLGSVIGSLFDSLIKGISSLFGGGGGGLGGIFSGIFGGIFGGGGNVFGGELGIGGMTLAEGMLGAVPFQHGGYVKKPTLALIGEAGPELVIPEKKFGSMIAGLTMASERTESGITINAPTYITAPEPERYQASKNQIESRRIQELRRAMRNT